MSIKLKTEHSSFYKDSLFGQVWNFNVNVWIWTIVCVIKNFHEAASHFIKNMS